MELWENWFLKALNNFNLTIDEKRLNYFKDYLNLIIYYNQKFNLTGEKSKEEIAIKQFIDSLLPIVYLKENKLTDKALDIGTGAGIPAIPIKIICDNLSFTLIEANKKRVIFLKRVVENLNLKNISVLDGRAEELIKKKELKNLLRENFDFVFSRWVLKVPGIFELVSPFVRVGGKIFLWKGIDEIEIVNQNLQFLNELGVEIEEIYRYKLPYYESERAILILKKINNTPEKFPRSFKRIKALFF